MKTNGKAGQDSSIDWTIREIEQQPDIWKGAIERVAERRQSLNLWLAPLLARPDLRIVLTGAGSSAYVGDALAPVLTRHLRHRVEAISTTAIVGNPESYLLSDRPTLLISYARSGNSPESVAAVELADQLISNCYHLIICCNPESALFRASRGSPDRIGLLMPEASLDQSFAMTSSFTAMMISTLAIFAQNDAQAEATIAAARRLLAAPRQTLDAIVDQGFSRIVFLGSGGIQGIATEAALKVLELSAGRTISYSESALGLRHGPKFVLDDTTLVLLLTNPDAHARLYDMDLLNELNRDRTAKLIVRLDHLIGLDDTGLDEAWIGLVYLVWCQLLAYRNALRLGISPDDPSPSGVVNRVVQGVVVHPFFWSGA